MYLAQFCIADRRIGRYEIPATANPESSDMTSPLPLLTTKRRSLSATLLSLVTLALCLAAGFSVPARAQIVAMTEVEPPSLVPAEQSSDSSLPEEPLPASDPTVSPASEASLLGVPRRFHFSLELIVSSTYSDNINISHTDRMSDIYTSIQPVLTLGVGDIMDRQENFLRLDYAPSLFLFVDHTDNNALQHLIHLQGQHRFSRLTLNLTQDIQILDGANLDAASPTGPINNRINLDVAARTRVNIYNTRLGASYDLTGKLSLSSELGLSISDYETLISSQVFSGNVFLNYAYSPKLTIGLGGTGGIHEVDEPNPDQTFQQINGRLSYQVTGKVSLNASAGAEFRDYEGSGRGESVSPVFDIGATFQPFDGTTLALNANRRTMSSAVLAAQDFANTSVIFTARQRLLRRFTLGFLIGFENSDYYSTTSGADSARTDNYFFVEPSLDVAVTRFWSIGAYYLYRRSDSSLDVFSFYDNQFGLRTSLKF